MKIKDLFNIKKSNTTSREFFSNNGINCIHYGDIYKNYSYKIILSSKIINKFSLNIEKEKIIYSDSLILPDVTETISDFGHITYIKYDNFPYINGTHTFAITPKVNVENNLKYLFYYLQSPKIKKQLQTLLLGSTVFQISKKDLENFELQNMHNKDDQQHIVDIIVSIDDKIENNQKLIGRLEKLAELLFDNLYCNAINSNNYKICKLKDYAETIITGTTPSTKEDKYWGNDINFITIPDMQNNIFIINTERK